MQSKIIFLTGASSGVGQYTAEYLAQQGHRVYGTSRKASFGHTVQKFPSGGQLSLIPLDVCDAASITTAVDYIWQKEGRIDVLINNAGNGIAGPLEACSMEDIRFQMETYFFGALAVTRAVLPLMRDQQAGRIINLSSLAAQIPIPYQSLYSASKAALEIAMQALAMETHSFGIHTVCIELGDTQTGFTAHRRFAAPSSALSAYQPRFQYSIAKMEQDEQTGPTPLYAAKAIARLVERRHPPALCCCCAFAKAVYLLRKLLPLRWSNAIIARLYNPLSSRKRG